MSELASIVIPAHNESAGLRLVLPGLKRLGPAYEIVVVDDGSTDDSAQVAAGLGVKVVRQPRCMGNGAAIKAGARAAQGDVLIFMDGDGQHSPDDVTRLHAELRDGYVMVVGARQKESQASIFRSVANCLYNLLASWMTGQPIADLTSGFRVARADRFREFLYLLPNGFSYPTTITMAFLRSGYPVKYVPIVAAQRLGRSHIRPLRDGLRFLVIIFRIGTLYSPLKIFVPASAFLFAAGLANYAYTFVTQGRFTNMSAMLLMASLLAFLIGLVSEQITALMFQHRD